MVLLHRTLVVEEEIADNIAAEEEQRSFAEEEEGFGNYTVGFG